MSADGTCADRPAGAPGVAGAERIDRVRVHRASGVLDSDRIPPVAIEIFDDLPSSDGMYGATTSQWTAFMRSMEDTYEEDARLICRALRAALPGATLDRLLGELLLSKASMYRVSVFDPRTPQDEEESRVVARALAQHREARARVTAGSGGGGGGDGEGDPIPDQGGDAPVGDRGGQR